MNVESTSFLVTASPHIRTKRSVQSIMLDVIIALIPTLIISIITFGYRAFLVVFISVFASVLSEWFYQKITKQKVRIFDLSAIITGIILAYSLPVGIPLWIPFVGSFFAIVLVKQIFGGIGQNFMNPAMAGRALLLAAYAGPMTAFLYGRQVNIDGIAGPTPLSSMQGHTMIFSWYEPFMGSGQYWYQAFLHNPNGSLGEVSALALIIGGIYLIIRRVISWRMPVFFIATLAIFTWVFRNPDAFFSGQPLFELAFGGAMLGAFFIVTDYSSSPMSTLGQIIFAIGVGALTGIIRIWATFPEGLSYAIILMNLIVPLIDKVIKPRVYGTKNINGGM